MRLLPRPRYRYIFRSAATGRIVSRWYAITHPSTTVRERVERTR